MSVSCIRSDRFERKRRAPKSEFCVKMADLKLREERQNCLSVKIKNMRIRNFETRSPTFISDVETFGCRANTLHMPAIIYCILLPLRPMSLARSPLSCLTLIFPSVKKLRRRPSSAKKFTRVDMFSEIDEGPLLRYLSVLPKFNPFRSSW